jgi:hypothetical protein
MTSGETPTFAEMEERLYGADLDEFVKERTAAAKELRARGERGEAAAVAKLPKPSVAAWIVNRLARDEPGPVAELLEAGERLREVQLGAGSASDLRSAADAQESAIRTLMKAGEEAAAARGSASPATLDRVRETLHAAALDADVAEQVRRGVLVREERAVGFPMGLAIPEERRRSPAQPKPKAKPPAEPKAEATPKQRDEVGAKRRERATAAAEKAAEGLDDAETALAAAQEELAAAERRARDARRAADRAEKVRDRAAADAERALARLREL